jgi:GTP cyclohydrolase I
MFVFLPHQFKGTHMSRFVKILNDHEKEISYTSFNEMLRKCCVKWPNCSKRNRVISR